MTLPNRTKIVATLGPASDNEKVLAELIRAGANIFRVNCSHSERDGIIEKIKLIRKVASELNAEIGILADLQGPKMRIGPLKGEIGIQLDVGAALTIVSDKTFIGEAPAPGETIRVGTGYELLCEDVKPGEKILIDDGNIEVEVTKVVGKDVHTKIIYGGLLKQKKGINLPGTAVSAKSLSEKDVNDLATALEFKADFIALSFVREAQELRDLRKMIRDAGSSAKIISKIERPEAIDNLEEIIEESYGVMVARGDMGVELGPEVVPGLQKRIIRLSLAARRPVITATQMLESMITNPRPTRAEASDVANAIYDSSSAVMLSAETAAGDFPARTVQIMGSIIRTTEAEIYGDNYRYAPQSQTSSNGPPDVALATVRAGAYAALEAGAKLIAVFTDSGATALNMACERSSTPIWAFTPNEETVQRLSLTWGVNARKIDKCTTSQEETLEGEKYLRDHGIAEKGDRIVVIFGTTRDVGMTNVMNIRTL